MTELFSKKILNNLSALEQLLEEISEGLEKKQIPSQAVQLALEEIITNTLKYGYPDNSEHLIEVQITTDESCLLVTIVDDGREFNPLLAAEADTTKPIEEREIGGLGLHLVRKLTTAMNYTRLAQKNILELKFTNPPLKRK